VTPAGVVRDVELRVAAAGDGDDMVGAGVERVVVDGEVAAAVSEPTRDSVGLRANGLGAQELPEVGEVAHSSRARPTTESR